VDHELVIRESGTGTPISIAIGFVSVPSNNFASVS
jgi:hypothetical protein